MVKKVALQTCTTNNYGGVLQAYALKHSIESLGYECDVLPFLRYEEKRLTFKQHVKKVVYYILGKKVYRIPKMPARKIEKFDTFRRDFLNISEPFTRDKDIFCSYNEIYKTFVCGSDLIWDPLLKKDNLWYDMLGFVDNTSCKISYAPSIGIPEFPEECREEAYQYLKDFSFLSCREDEGTELIKSTFGLEAKHVLDPTLLITAEEWRKHFTNENIKPYCFMYLFDREPVDEIIQKVLKETDLDIRITSFENVYDSSIRRNARVHLEEFDCGPLDFISLISGAELVICNSFHGMAFSLNFNTPFLIFLREDNSKYSVNSRLHSLKRLFDISDRVLSRDVDIETLDVLKLMQFDFSKTNEILARERIKSINYLREALKNG